MFSTAGLARISARRPWFVVAPGSSCSSSPWVAATGLGDAFTTEGNFTNQPESVRADDLLKERLRGGQDEPVTETVIVRSDTVTVDDAAFQQVVEQTAADLRAMPEIVADVTTYYDAVAAGAPEAARAGLGRSPHDADPGHARRRHRQPPAITPRRTWMPIAAQGGDGFQVLTVGDISVGDEFNTLAESDLVKGEGLGLLAALVDPGRRLRRARRRRRADRARHRLDHRRRRADRRCSAG